MANDDLQDKDTRNAMTQSDMFDKLPISRGKQKRRRFFHMMDYIIWNPAGLIFENEAELVPPGQRYFSPIDRMQRGFSRHPAGMRPIIRYDKRKGRKPTDLEAFAGYWYWLISDATKSVFETVDRTAFDFVPCDLILDEALPAGRRWLCDVVRILDALDDGQSDAQIMSEGRKRYYLGGARKLVFKENVVGASHIFRMEGSEPSVVCDDVMRNACKDARLKGLMFIDAIHK